MTEIITLTDEQVNAMKGAGVGVDALRPTPTDPLIEKATASIACKSFFGPRGSATFRQRCLAYVSFSAFNYHAWTWHPDRSWNE